jgi:hypothetical protein
MHHTHVAAQRPTEGKAIASFVLGVLSLACIGVFAGLPAIILGSMARRDIERSNGGLGGRALAAGGIVAGLFGTGFGFVLLLWVLGAVFAPPLPETNPMESTRALASTAAGELSPAIAPPPAVAAGTRSYGSLEVVDLDDSRPLRAQLGEIVQRSHGRTVVLQTYLSSSSVCAAIAAALPDMRMQRALANVTLVRVDVEEYGRELGVMKVETQSAPWFYKLDAKGDPTDAISADAWEANVPENMAPVLGKFVHRGPARRASR